MTSDPEKEKKIVPSESSGVTIKSKDDISTEIDFRLAKQLLKIGVWVISGVGVLVLGAFIGAFYEMNGRINELSGSYSSSGKYIERLENNIQKLEVENKMLNDKIHNLEIEKLQEKINRHEFIKK